MKEKNYLLFTKRDIVIIHKQGANHFPREYVKLGVGAMPTIKDTTYLWALYITTPQSYPLLYMSCAMQALPYGPKQELRTHHHIGRPLSHSIVRMMITSILNFCRLLYPILNFFMKYTRYTLQLPHCLLWRYEMEKICTWFFVGKYVCVFMTLFKQVQQFITHERVENNFFHIFYEIPSLVISLDQNYGKYYYAKINLIRT